MTVSIATLSVERGALFPARGDEAWLLIGGPLFRDTVTGCRAVVFAPPDDGAHWVLVSYAANLPRRAVL